MAKKKLSKQELRIKKLTALVRLLFATKDVVTPSTSGQGGSAGLMLPTDKEKLDNLPSWSQAASKPTYAYDEIGYNAATAADNGNTAGIITIDGTKPLTVIALTGNVSSLAIASGKNPPKQHSAHVILTNASTTAYTVTIAHNATTSICPTGKDPDPIEVAAGGYAEIDFLCINTTSNTANDKIYVRGL